MTTTTFGSLGYFEKLKDAGVPEEQAKLQAAAFREFRPFRKKTPEKSLPPKWIFLELRPNFQKK